MHTDLDARGNVGSSVDGAQLEGTVLYDASLDAAQQRRENASTRRQIWGNLCERAQPRMSSNG